MKNKALRWFMTLGINSIRTWDDMKRVFLEKYKNHYKHHDVRNEVFKMNQKEDENLEYLVERFTFNIKRSKMHNLGSDILKNILLNAIKDEWIDLLNVVGKGDVYQLSFQEICELCKNILRGKENYGRSPQDLVTARESKLTTGLVSQTELNNLLNILDSLNDQIEMLRMQNKKNFENVALHECPLDNIKICKICAGSHTTKDCPSLPGLKVVYEKG